VAGASHRNRSVEVEILFLEVLDWHGSAPLDTFEPHAGSSTLTLKSI
jgi:hypothetical protein